MAKAFTPKSPHGADPGFAQDATDRAVEQLYKLPRGVLSPRFVYKSTIAELGELIIADTSIDDVIITLRTQASGADGQSIGVAHYGGLGSCMVAPADGQNVNRGSERIFVPAGNVKTFTLHRGGRFVCDDASQAAADTKAPAGEWKTTSTIDFAARSDSQHSVVSLVLQDGVRRIMPATLTWDIANGVGELGYDAAASQGNSKWLYFYAVPSSRDSYLTIVASSSNPSTGPSGYTKYKYCFADYIDGSGNLWQIKQSGNNFYAPTTFPFTASAQAAFGWTSLDISGSVPQTAGAVRTLPKIISTSPGQYWIYDNSGWSGVFYASVDVSTTSDRGQTSSEIPIVTQQTIYHRLRLTAGAGTCLYVECTVTGWRDDWIDP